MAQSDYELAAHISGLNQRTEINSIFDSILTHNSGSNAPTVTKAFMMWVDTSNATYYYLKMRNHDNTAWVTLFIYTVSTKIITPFIINSPTTNVIPKINADGTLGNSNIINDANGNVGIGVAPSAWTTFKALEIGTGNGHSLYGSGGISGETHLSTNVYYNSGYKYTHNDYACDYKQESGGHYWRTAPSGTAGNAITWTTAMSLYPSGELLTQFTGIANSIGYMTRSVSVAGTGYYHYVGQSNGVDVIRITGNGNVTNINNSYGALSDIKLKENVIDVTPKLDKLMQVRVVNYNLIGDTTKQIGVIAQEIEKIFPSVVDETKDTEQVEVTKTKEVTDEEGNVTIEEYTETETVETGEVTKNVKYSVIYMMMLKGMQEQQAIINDLKARIEVLESK